MTNFAFLLGFEKIIENPRRSLAMIPTIDIRRAGRQDAIDIALRAASMRSYSSSIPDVW